MTDQLVDCIMPPYIFTQELELSIQRKETSGMQSTGMLEHSLLCTQLPIQRIKTMCWNSNRVCFQWRHREYEVCDTILAAETTTGGDREMPFKADRSALLL